MGVLQIWNQGQLFPACFWNSQGIENPVADSFEKNENSCVYLSLN